MRYLTLRHKLWEWIFIYLSKNEMRFPSIIIIDVCFSVSVTYRQYRYDSEWVRFFVFYSRCYCNALKWYWRWIDCSAYILYSLCNFFRSFCTSLNKWMSEWMNERNGHRKMRKRDFQPHVNIIDCSLTGDVNNSTQTSYSSRMMNEKKKKNEDWKNQIKSIPKTTKILFWLHVDVILNKY